MSRILNNFQLASSLALTQVTGEAAAVLMRSVCMRYPETLVFDYTNIGNEIDAIRECGRWFSEARLCNDFDLCLDGDSLYCSWYYHSVLDVDFDVYKMTINNLMIGTLWALLSIKTDGRWNHYREIDEDKKLIKVVFRKYDT